MPPDALSPEDRIKFRQVTYHQFFKKAVFVLSLLIMIQIVFLYVALFSLPEDFARGWASYLCYYCMAILVLSALLVLCERQRQKKPEQIRDQHLDVPVGFAIMLSAIAIVLLNERIEGMQSNYLLGLMIYALLIRVDLRRLILQFGVIQLIYILLLHVFLTDKSHIAAIIFNSSIFTLAAVVISFMLYNQDLQSFMQNVIITEQNEQLYRMSYLDPVINIYNRRYLFETGSLMLRWCQKTGKSFAVIMLDIDAFKEYNDRYGHPAGDECLAVLGEIIRENTTASDAFGARYGGEEITVVVTDRPPEALAELAETLRQQLYDRNIAHETSPYGTRLTLSAGIAIYTPDALPGLDMDTAVLQADKALYEAKKSGRNAVCVHVYPARAAKTVS